jgi:hypothetical protein
MGLRATRAVLVVGDAPVLNEAAAALEADGLCVRRIEGQKLPTISQRASLLLLADGPDLDLQLRWAESASRRRRRPLRVTVLRPDMASSPHGAGGAGDPAGNATPGDGLRVDWIDPYRSAARTLLARWPLHRSFDPPYGQQPHLLIAGFGPFARACLLQALRVGQYAEEPPVVSLVAEDVRLWREWIAVHLPQASQCGRLRFAGAPTLDVQDAPPVTTAVVCDMPGAGALARARALLVAAASRGESPVALLAADAQWSEAPLGDWDGQLVPVRPLALAFARETLLEGRGDALAEVIHEHYRDTSSAQGRDPAAAPSGRPWSELASSYRDANRHQADHLWAKLAVTDCRAVPEELVESFAFAPAEIEQLAIIEHRRWAVERWLDSWTYGPERDNARKRHPQLIPYADLSDAMQDLDRFAVRLVPSLLARSGLGVVRRLIVAVSGRGDSVAAPPTPLPRLALRRVLTQLARRYPDRGLTLALDPSDASARHAATVAVEHSGAGLFLLLPRALRCMLEAVAASERREILALAALAERRIPLRGGKDLRNWMATRAEILWCLDLGPAAEAQAPQPPKRVQMDARGAARWNFTY